MGSVGGSATSKNPSLPEASKLNDYDANELKKQLGQTGNEAGDPFTNPNNKVYANSGKAFCINAYLNSDGETIKSVNTDWDNYISKTWVQNAINKIDKGMKPLPKSINVTRFVTADAFEKMTGIKMSDSLIQKIASGDGGAELATALKGLDYTQKAYTSTTYVNEHPSYGDYPIALNMVMREGTKAIITNNTPEHEILGARNLKYNFTGGYSVKEVPVYAKSSDGKGHGEKIGTRLQLVLDMYV